MTRQIDLDKTEYTTLFKCTRCGQCTYGKEAAEFTVLCPVYKKGHFFSYSAGGMMQIARNLYEGKIDYSNSLKDMAFLCTTCGVCEANCGVIDTHLEIIGRIRACLLEKESPQSAALSEAAGRIAAHKNPYGQPHAGRTAWLRNSREPVDRPSADIFYYTGCVSAYDQKTVPRALDGILSRLGIAYTVSSQEQCCGGPLFFAGLVGQAATLARHNIGMIEKTGIRTVVVSCPTCALMFRNYYPRWTGKDLPFTVLHTMEYLGGLLEQGTLGPLALKKPVRAVYHDSCHLGRGLGVFDAPRQLLGAVGNLELTEFGLCRENAMCCGGGGMVPVTNPQFSVEIASDRVNAIPVHPEGRPDRLVSACPNCRKTLGLALKRQRAAVAVEDVCELILEAMPVNG